MSSHHRAGIGIDVVPQVSRINDVSAADEIRDTIKHFLFGIQKIGGLSANPQQKPSDAPACFLLRESFRPERLG